MRTILPAAVVAATLAWAALPITAAEGTRFRFLAAVYGDGTNAGFHLPEGVACGKGEVVVADTGNDRLIRFAFRDKAVSGWTVIKLPELSSPTRVQFDSQGGLYALDARRRRIVRIGADGQFKGALSLDGVPPPATIVPKSFAVGEGDRLYVLDVFSARVLVLAGDGAFQKSLPLPPGAGFVTDVAVDPLGNVLVLDAIGRRLYSADREATAFTPLGATLADTLVTMPTSLAAARGLVLIVEGSAGSIVSVGQDGTFLSRQLTAGWQEGSLNHPAQVCVNDADEAVVADRDNSRVQVFTLGR